MTTSPVIRMSATDKAEIEASKEPGQNTQARLDRLAKLIDLGTSFIGVVSVMPSQSRATFEVRGISRRAWMDRLRKSGGDDATATVSGTSVAVKKDSELPSECSVKTSINLRVTGPVANDFTR